MILRQRDPKATDYGELFHPELKPSHQQQNYDVV